jgi:hypothetical protein
MLLLHRNLLCVLHGFLRFYGEIIQVHIVRFLGFPITKIPLQLFVFMGFAALLTVQNLFQTEKRPASRHFGIYAQAKAPQCQPLL